MRIAKAQPNYLQRIRCEATSSDSDEAATLTASVSEHNRLEDPDADGAAQLSYRIRSPQGQVWMLPSSGTGNKKSLFMPVKQLSMEQCLCQDLDTRSSSRYYTNAIWEQMVDAQVRRPALDPELFSSTAVLPVPMVRLHSKFLNMPYPSRAMKSQEHVDTELCFAVLKYTV